MKNFWLLLLLGFVQNTNAQKLKKAEQPIFDNLKSYTNFLAADALEGRRTGTDGEKKAAAFIQEKFTTLGLQPLPNKGFLQPFDIYEGKFPTAGSYFFLGDKELAFETEYFPFPFSGLGSMEALTSAALPERGAIWFYNLQAVITENSNNPHFNLEEHIITTTEAMAKKGAAALLVYSLGSSNPQLTYTPLNKTATTTIPVFYITPTVAAKYFTDPTAVTEVKYKVVFEERKKTGHNVVATINNNAPHTVIIGAHYDHLGYGEDKNSLYAGSEPQIHNGADDNASGTAALIELAAQISKLKKQKFNYVFAAFSGEELGLYGSKNFVETNSTVIASTNYMINMDMVGRLNDSTKGLNIGGFGTSPTWGSIINTTDKYFTIKLDSSGTGPSDHTSFYRKDVPVLFFFTGTHTDYHKPTDDAEKINTYGQLKIVQYITELVTKTNKLPKLTFTKTREVATSAKSSFKVTLGIMPDYTFTGTGLRVDGVVDGKIAQQIGLLQGDIIVQLGEKPITDVQNYMQSLGSFSKGQASRVKVLRGAKTIWFDFVF
jgi:aminopeptidase YwaD